MDRAAADVGQSLGMTATGLMVLRVADPDGRSPVLGAFGYEQLVFEPVVGGGLFTAASVALVASVGGWPVLIGTAALCAAWLVLGRRLFGTHRTITGRDRDATSSSATVPVTTGRAVMAGPLGSAEAST